MNVMLRTCIELIAIPNPLQADLANVIEGDQVIVSRNAVDGLYSNFLQAPKEILCSM
jgi:hypothetical protein